MAWAGAGAGTAAATAAAAADDDGRVEADECIEEAGAGEAESDDELDEGAVLAMVAGAPVDRGEKARRGEHSGGGDVEVMRLRKPCAVGLSWRLVVLLLADVATLLLLVLVLVLVADDDEGRCLILEMRPPCV